jgi:hypothetical protein
MAHGREISSAVPRGANPFAASPDEAIRLAGPEYSLVFR